MITNRPKGRPLGDRVSLITCARQEMADAHALLSAALGFGEVEGVNPRNAASVASALAKAETMAANAARMLGDALAPLDEQPQVLSPAIEGALSGKAGAA